MDVIKKKPNLLIIRGVYPKDFTVQKIVPKKTVPEIEYSEIPKRFVSVIDWPRFSNLKCWDCDQLPSSYPKFVPLNPITLNGHEECDVHGNFCEWNCVVRYINSEFSIDQRKDILDNVKLFESKFSLKRKVVIPPSPKKTEMKAYCGARGITPQQWQDKLRDLNSEHTLTHYKMEHFTLSTNERYGT
jgi:hypothetical protein